MPFPLQKRSSKAGLSPGSLVHVGKKYSEKSRVTLVRYNETFFEEKEMGSLANLEQGLDGTAIVWINVDGLQDVQIFERLGEIFRLHPLVLEDILNTDQRPRQEDYGDYLYLVLKNFYSGEGKKILSDQVSIILGKGFVLSFQEKENPLFESIKEKIKKSKGRIRTEKADFLVHALVDNIVDRYFVVLENLEERIETLEGELLKKPSESCLQEIHHLKRNLIVLSKSLWPLREAVSLIGKTDSQLIQKSTGPYFKDVYDHIIDVIDTVETFKDMLSGILDVYLDTVSNKLNEVMKMLTIIATIFMPLTFIVGIYGMNFKYMPELEWRWGYFGVLGLMLAVALCMIYFFKRKKWL